MKKKYLTPDLEVRSLKLCCDILELSTESGGEIGGGEIGGGSGDLPGPELPDPGGL